MTGTTPESPEPVPPHEEVWVLGPSRAPEPPAPAPPPQRAWTPPPAQAAVAPVAASTPAPARVANPLTPVPTASAVAGDGPHPRPPGPQPEGAGPEPRWGFAGTGRSLADRGARTLAIVGVIVGLLGGSLVYAATGRHQDGHLMRLSFAAGHVYRFALRGGFEGRLVFASGSRTIRESVQGLLTWRVTDVDPEGGATILAAFDRASPDGAGTGGPPVGWRVKVTGDGRIVSASPARSPAAGTAGLLFSLRQMSPLLPAGPVEPGATWTVAFDQALEGQGGPATITARSTLIRYDTVDHVTTAILTSDIVVPPVGGTRGSIFQRSWFDPVAGSIVESSILSHVDMSVRGPGPSSRPRRIVGTATVQLQPLPGAGSAGEGDDAAGARARRDLRLALSAADIFYTANRSYQGLSPRKASSIASSLRWAGNDRARPSIISIRTARASSVLLVTRTEQGARYCIARTPAGVSYGRVGATRVEGCSGGWGED